MVRLEEGLRRSNPPHEVVVAPGGRLASSLAAAERVSGRTRRRAGGF
jgi:hypothetical protein